MCIVQIAITQRNWEQQEFLGLRNLRKLTKTLSDFATSKTKDV